MLLLLLVQQALAVDVDELTLRYSAARAAEKTTVDVMLRGYIRAAAVAEEDAADANQRAEDAVRTAGERSGEIVSLNKKLSAAKANLARARRELKAMVAKAAGPDPGLADDIKRFEDSIRHLVSSGDPRRRELVERYANGDRAAIDALLVLARDRTVGLEGEQIALAREWRAVGELVAFDATKGGRTTVDAIYAFAKAVLLDPADGSSWTRLAELRLDAGDFDGAAAALGHAGDLAADAATRARVAAALGDLEVQRGSLDAALTAYSASLAATPAETDDVQLRRGRAHVLFRIAGVHTERRDWEEARAALVEAAELRRSLVESTGDPFDQLAMANLFGASAWIADATGRPEDALADTAAARGYLDAAAALPTAVADDTRARLDLAQGQRDMASTRFDAARLSFASCAAAEDRVLAALPTAWGANGIKSSCLYWEGEASLMLGDPVGAERSLLAASRLQQELVDRYGTADAVVSLAITLIRRAEVATASGRLDDVEPPLLAATGLLDPRLDADPTRANLARWSVRAHFNLASVYEAHLLLDQATRELEAGLRRAEAMSAIRADDPVAWGDVAKTLIGALQQRLGRADLSLVPELVRRVEYAVTTALALAPDDQPVLLLAIRGHHVVGDAYVALGDRVAAGVSFDAAAALAEHVTDPGLKATIGAALADSRARASSVTQAATRARLEAVAVTLRAEAAGAPTDAVRFQLAAVLMDLAAVIPGEETGAAVAALDEADARMRELAHGTGGPRVGAQWAGLQARRALLSAASGDRERSDGVLAEGVEAIEALPDMSGAGRVVLIQLTAAGQTLALAAAMSGDPVAHRVAVDATARFLAAAGSGDTPADRLLTATLWVALGEAEVLAGDGDPVRSTRVALPLLLDSPLPPDATRPAILRCYWIRASAAFAGEEWDASEAELNLADGVALADGPRSWAVAHTRIMRGVLESARGRPARARRAWRTARRDLRKLAEGADDPAVEEDLAWIAFLEQR